MTTTNGDLDTEIYNTADAAFQDCRDLNEHAHDYRTGSCC
ncbi:MAG: hypothetical protein JWO67_784, partial [Streptosporangiaceae bacterium]|nr:hypothetical protein [Streptosporangiaceae bacterium]